MDIFGVVLVDTIQDGSRAHPKDHIGFRKFYNNLAEEINKINPTYVLLAKNMNFNIDEEFINKLNCNIKCCFGSGNEWQKSGLIQGNWLWTGLHWGICIQKSLFGIINALEVKKTPDINKYKYDLGEVQSDFNILIRPDLILRESPPNTIIGVKDIECDVDVKWQKLPDGNYWLAVDLLHKV